MDLMSYLRPIFRHLMIAITTFSLVSAAQLPVLAQAEGGGDAPEFEMADTGHEIAFDTPEAIKDYKLSVGDTIAVNLWATDLRFNQTFTIPFEGKIYIPSLGEIPVNRRTTAEVQAELLSRLKGKIKDLRASVLLVRARMVNVYVTGLVRKPGIATVPVLSRLSSAIAKTGGILPEGSWRRIKITHTDGKSDTVDWYKFIHRGDLKANPRLVAGDVINVVPLGNQVTISGAVHKPGSFETLPGETIEDLIFWAHGTTPSAALDKSSIAHWLTDVASDRQEKPLDLSKASVMATKLQNRDRINIPTNTLTYIPMDRTQVHIQGFVNKEGYYTLTIGQTLRDLFTLAGGPKPEAGLREVKIYHKAMSGGAAGAPSNVVNAYKLLYEKDDSQNVDLQDGDLVVVPSNKLPMEDSVVNVQGLVGKPGRIPYRVGYKLSDYLNAAGGPEAKANLRDVIVTRAGKRYKVDAFKIMREGRTEGDLEMQEGDVVFVPEAFFYVANAQDVVNIVLAALAVWAAVRPLTSK